MKSNETITLEVQARVPGKHNNQVVRSNAAVPGNIYGPKMKNISLSTPERGIQKYISHTFDNTIFTLKSSESTLNGLQVIMKHKEIHPVTRRLTHIDFYALDLTKTIKVKIELRFVGKARGIADGGLFQPIAREIEIECLPNAIPDYFEVDISDLGVHDSAHASDIKLPEGMKLISDAGLTLATVTIIKEEEATPQAAAAAGAATPAAEPEVIAKGKKDKEGEGAAAPAAGGAKK
ncbi:MAG: 50S ribosomal protein L25 [Bdellovibrionales bacterium]